MNQLFLWIGLFEVFSAVGIYQMMYEASGREPGDFSLDPLNYCSDKETYEDMKLKEEPFHNSWTPFSHEGRRRSRIAMNQLEAAGKHAMGEKVNLSVATLHRTIDDLVDRNDSKTSSSTLSSDFTNLEKHVNELVETTMKSEKQVNELKHRLLLATNALKEATGGAGKSGDPLGKS